MKYGVVYVVGFDNDIDIVCEDEDDAIDWIIEKYYLYDATDEEKDTIRQYLEDYGYYYGHWVEPHDYLRKKENV